MPYTWKLGTCVIGLDTHSPEDEDTFRLMDIAVQATLLNIGCVAPEPHYGGTVQVGPRAVMNVTILGWPFIFPQEAHLQLGGYPDRSLTAGR